MSNASVPTYKSGKKSVPAQDSGASPESRAAAMEFLSRLAAELSTGTVDLPCFPDVVIKIRKTLDDPNTNTDRTVTVVGTEPRLAARLLQTANSAAFNTTGKPLTDLRTAITRLGQQMVQSAAMAYAVQQMKDEQSLRSIAKPMSELWRECITVAAICHVVARRTKVPPDTAFLTGLLHGIGRLYIMVRAVADGNAFGNDGAFIELVAGWHAQIGKAVLENWQFAEEMSEAIGDQSVYERRSRHDPDLTDVLVASIVLAGALQRSPPRNVAMDGISAFQSLGLSDQDCTALLTHAEYQVGALYDALGC
jgi:HD-like signal output (HDOD) protein